MFFLTIVTLKYELANWIRGAQKSYKKKYISKLKCVLPLNKCGIKNTDLVVTQTSIGRTVSISPSASREFIPSYGSGEVTPRSVCPVHSTIIINFLTPGNILQTNAQISKKILLKK